MDNPKDTSVIETVAESASGALDLAFVRDAENPTVCVVDGYGVRVTISSGRLVISDGIGAHRRERVHGKANHGLARLVIVATTGHVTVEALRWLDGAGVSLVVLDPITGEVMSTSTQVANDNARLRRAQALAPGTETGLAVAKYLTTVKLAGQASIARYELKTPAVAETITHLAGRLNESASLVEIQQFEASAANLYWSAWSSTEIRFTKKDASRVPENWLCFEGRRSAINPGSSRNASDPTNAMLNYLYRLLEAEGHLATLAVGLDPGLGVLHADTRGRASFVLDLIEAVRPTAERYVLRLIRSQPLQWRDFHEDPRGVVRVLAPLTHRLAEAMPGFAVTLAPVVEHVAQMIASASPYDISNPSILTREKHKAAARRRVDTSLQKGSSIGPVGPGSIGLGPRKKGRQRPSVENEPPLPLPICRGCGAVLEREPDRIRRRGTYCPKCLAQRRAEIGSTLPAASAKRRLDFEKQAGLRPTHSPQAREKRSRAMTLQRAQQSIWEAGHSTNNHDPEWFDRDILPNLRNRTLTEIAQAAGVSTSSASKFRAGRLVPHPRHWAALETLVGTQGQVPVAERFLVYDQSNTDPPAH